MSRIGERERHARRKRKGKLRKLRLKYGNAKSAGEKEKVVVKLGRIVPWLSEENFKAPMKKKEVKA